MAKEGVSVPKSTFYQLDPADAPDPSTVEAMHMLGVAKETIYRLAKAKLISGYLLAGKRRWDRQSLYAYVASCKAAGPQFAPALPAKRARGRPKRPRPEAATASPAE
jgi:hypothetical protein